MRPGSGIASAASCLEQLPCHPTARGGYAISAALCIRPHSLPAKIRCPISVWRRRLAFVRAEGLFLHRMPLWNAQFADVVYVGCQIDHADLLRVQFQSLGNDATVARHAKNVRACIRILEFGRSRQPEDAFLPPRNRRDGRPGLPPSELWSAVRFPSATCSIGEDCEATPSSGFPVERLTQKIDYSRLQSAKANTRFHIGSNHHDRQAAMPSQLSQSIGDGDAVKVRHVVVDNGEVKESFHPRRQERHEDRRTCALCHPVRSPGG